MHLAPTAAADDPDLQAKIEAREKAREKVRLEQQRITEEQMEITRRQMKELQQQLTIAEELREQTELVLQVSPPDKPKRRSTQESQPEISSKHPRHNSIADISVASEDDTISSLEESSHQATNCVVF